MWWSTAAEKLKLPSPEEALPGRAEAIPTAERHAVTGRPLKGPHPADHERILFAMGCFWGAERLFWQAEGVSSTAVGYAGGLSSNPSYREVCSGLTGHTEVVEVIYAAQPGVLEGLLSLFWERHDPTQGMRQGNDVGTQYRSAIYWETEAQAQLIERSRAQVEESLNRGGHSASGASLTTTIAAMPTFYFAEAEHQQYLHKNPAGYCGLKGTGLSCAFSPAR